MFPPTDSLQHQLLKLMEITSATTPNTQAPPPAYTPNIVAAQGQLLYDDSAAEEEDDEYDYDNDHSPPRTQQPAITININASLKIEGHGNTIMLPPQATSPSSSGGSSSKVSAATSLPQPASGPNTRAAKLTTIILSTLKDAGVLDSNGTSTPGETSSSQHERKRRPINLNIDAGIVLKGNRNLVCQGVSRVLSSKSNNKETGEAGTGAGAATTRKGKPGAEKGSLAHSDRDGGRDGGSESRKRRACSEPPELIGNPAKRIRTSTPSL